MTFDELMTQVCSDVEDLKKQVSGLKKQVTELEKKCAEPAQKGGKR